MHLIRLTFDIEKDGQLVSDAFLHCLLQSWDLLSTELQPGRKPKGENWSYTPVVKPTSIVLLIILSVKSPDKEQVRTRDAKNQGCLDLSFLRVS